MLNWSYGISFCFFTIQGVSTEVWHVLNTEMQSVLRTLAPTTRQARYLVPKVWWVGPYCGNNVLLNVMRREGRWYSIRADTILLSMTCRHYKAKNFSLSGPLAAHFLISVTALLTTVIHNDCQKTKQISLFRRCFSYLVFETSTLSKHWQFPKQVLCFKGFVLFGFFVLVTHGIGIVDWQSSIEQKLSSKLSSITPT